MTGKEILKLFLDAGWRIDRIRGSHHVLKKQGHENVSIPIHHGKRAELHKGTEEKLLKQLKASQ